MAKTGQNSGSLQFDSLTKSALDVVHWTMDNV